MTRQILVTTTHRAGLKGLLCTAVSMNLACEYNGSTTIVINTDRSEPVPDKLLKELDKAHKAALERGRRYEENWLVS